MSPAPKRYRGVVLTERGLERLESAIAAAQEQQKYGKRFTQAELEELTGISIKTIKKIRNCTAPVDEASVRILFEAFGLELDTADYGLPNTDEQNYQQTKICNHESGAGRTETPNSVNRSFKLPKGVPFQVPPLPYYFVERPEHQNAVKKILLKDAANHPGTLVVSAIYGLGGIGKSVLAMKLAHDTDVLARYPDGVLWATLGQQPDILAFLSHWIQALGDHSYQPITTSAASAHLRTLLADKQMLLVIDDVWHPEHAESFRIGSSECCVLITTREARIPQALRYPLDVMSPEQSLKLIAQKLSTPLDELTQQQALIFAERVGFLPLALELAASQIEDGITWTELLEDFQAEVARLETLDLYSQDDIPDDTRRRKYSLNACFQLSLKQLSAEQLCQFAWLGVVPEDVSLTQDMAMTLWQVPKRVAGAILRTFSSKALLLQGGQQSCQQTTYRMHDLMHDLAQTLLTSSQQPEKPGDLPGLRLTRLEAHRQLVEYYRQKTNNGQWHTLPDDGYIHAHLTWHLEQAEQYDQIHQLLQEATPAGQNGWYEACSRLDRIANFVTDVARAWRLAKVGYEQSSAQAIALQCRYALIKASLNSLAENFPPELIAVLVETGRWSPAKGLAHIQRVPIPWMKWKTLEELLPLLPDSLLEEALQISQGIEDKEGRAMAIIALSARMPNLQSVARKIAETLSDPFFQTLAWWLLSFHDPSLWSNIIRLLTTIQKENQRAFALKKIAFNAPDSHLSDLLAIARNFKDVDNEAIAMGVIAARLPILQDEIRETLLKRVETIEDTFRRATAFSTLAPIISELWLETLSLVKSMRHEAAQVDILTDLVHYIPENLLDEIVDIARSFQSEKRKASLLGVLVKRRPSLWQEALDTTKIIEDSGLRVSVMSRFALGIKSLLPFVFDETQNINRSYDQAVALSALAIHDASLWRNALKSVNQIRDVYDRARAYQSLSSEMPELWQEVLETVQEIQGAIFQVWCLRDLVPQMSELWPATLDALERLWFEGQQAHHIYRLANKVPASQVGKAIEICKNIRDETARILALSVFTEQDSRIIPEINSALKSLSFQNDEEHYFALILGGLAVRNPENWPEVIDSIQEICSEEQKSTAIQGLASKIPEYFVNIVLEICLCIESDFYRATALFELLPYVDISILTYDQWCSILSALSNLNRPMLLKRLPLLTEPIAKFGTKDALIETAYAIRDVCQQW